MLSDEEERNLVLLTYAIKQAKTFLGTLPYPITLSKIGLESFVNTTVIIMRTTFQAMEIITSRNWPDYDFPKSLFCGYSRKIYILLKDWITFLKGAFLINALFSIHFYLSPPKSRLAFIELKIGFIIGWGPCHSICL